MEVIFTEEAKRDLDELRTYLEPLSPAGLATVVAALEVRIRAIADSPGIGRLTPRDDVREAVEAKYGFLIPYYVRGSKLFVLRVYRSARKPLDYEELKVENHKYGRNNRYDVNRIYYCERPEGSFSPERNNHPWSKLLREKRQGSERRHVENIYKRNMIYIVDVINAIYIRQII